MKVLQYFSTLVITCLILPSNGYRILGLFPFEGVSHFRMFERLMKGLAARGHQVDVVSHFPSKKSIPNYNDIVDLSEFSTFRQNNMSYEMIKPFINIKSMARLVVTTGGDSFCKLMGTPQFQKLVKNPPKDPPYDLVITEIFGAQCTMAMGQHFGVPVIGMITSAMLPWANKLVANPEESAYVAHLFSGHHGPMNFWQRFVNTVQLFAENLIFDYYTLNQNHMISEYIGPQAPGVRDAEKSISLILVNSHFSLQGVRPFSTAVIEVGGLHIPDVVEPLPNDLNQWLNESEDGFVYISFGSMLKLESFPKETLHEIYASFKKLSPVRILMRITNANELPPGLPNNVVTYPWVPQLAVLQHKNIRAFMTHGGLMGIQESIKFGVPMIGVPMFGDQSQNVEICVKKHVAVSLDLNALTEKNLDAAFEAILRDSSYSKAAKELSKRFVDRPMSPLDTAIFWVEYVIRNGDKNLRSPAMDLAWWQIELLDVYGVLLCCLLFSLYLFIVTINTLIRIISPKKNNKNIEKCKKAQ